MISRLENNDIQIKGIKEGILISIGDGNWLELQAQLISTINEKANFFKGAQIALDVGNHVLRAADLGLLRDKFADKGMNIWAVLGASPSTEMNAQMLGMATRLSAPAIDRKVNPMETENLPGEEAIMIARTLRSGYKVDYDGHVVVMGDVNPGAEISAGGSVLIWGKLRGGVHAGIPDNLSAKICALELNPTMLRIADVPFVPQKRKSKNLPEMARIVDNVLIIEAWKTK